MQRFLDEVASVCLLSIESINMALPVVSRLVGRFIRAASMAIVSFFFPAWIAVLGSVVASRRLLIDCWQAGTALSAIALTLFPLFSYDEALASLSLLCCVHSSFPSYSVNMGSDEYTGTF